MATRVTATFISEQDRLATDFTWAEALGLEARRIGAFYDDEVHRHLNIEPEQGQVVYISQSAIQCQILASIGNRPG
jgi:hypothetical protein